MIIVDIMWVYLSVSVINVAKYEIENLFVQMFHKSDKSDKEQIMIELIVVTWIVIGTIWATIIVIDDFITVLLS